ncbi:MAG: twin-arginine translocation signal domain-containing protein, partial [Gemmatimonadaceae bacterium]
MSDKPVSAQATDFLYGIASRRSFLRSAAATVVAGGALAACTDSSAQPSFKTKDESGGTTAPNPALPSVAATAAAMDAMHEAGIKAFPAKTEGKGNQLLAPRIEKGVKIYDITT